METRATADKISESADGDSFDCSVCDAVSPVKFDDGEHMTESNDIGTSYLYVEGSSVFGYASKYNGYLWTESND